MRRLSTPFRVGSTRLRNRLYRAPVLEGAGDGGDCAEVYAGHFVPNAEAGVGLIIQGSACLEPEGRTSPGMTCVHTRDRVLRLAPMVDAVHRAGAAIWLQVGHGGLYAMEAWHQPYASERRAPITVVSPLRWYLRPVFRRLPLAVLSTDAVHRLAERYGDVAAWAREAGYDGIQLASSNAKLLDQFLSPFYNRRTDEFGGSLEGRARVLRVIRERIAERAGEDFTCTVKVPVGEKSLPFAPHTTWDEGLRIAELAEEWGFHAVTPVEVSVFPDTTLSRGGIPSSLTENRAIASRFERAAPRTIDRRLIELGYRAGGRFSPFEPVWNRSRVRAVRERVDLPVLAVGGIRTPEEAEGLLAEDGADLVGVGRPFYAEPGLASRFLDPDEDPLRVEGAALCQNSNLCVPAQMLGMRGVCYNPEVTRVRAEVRTRR